MTKLNYKGYVATAEIDVEDHLIFGEVIGLKDTITFQGETVEEAIRAFHESVDLYLLTCEEQGLEPDRPASGAITVQIDPQWHHALISLAGERGQSLDQFVGQILIQTASNARISGEVTLTDVRPTVRRTKSVSVAKRVGKGKAG
jgi:predicted HicB family RNase H-like nuclease